MLRLLFTLFLVPLLAYIYMSQQELPPLEVSSPENTKQVSKEVTSTTSPLQKHLKKEEHIETQLKTLQQQIHGLTDQLKSFGYPEIMNRRFLDQKEREQINQLAHRRQVLKNQETRLKIKKIVTGEAI